MVGDEPIDLVEDAARRPVVGHVGRPVEEHEPAARGQVLLVEAPVPLVEVEGLVKHFPVRGGGGKVVVQAVSGVSFDLEPGRTLGLVGESGSGKSTVGRCVLRLLEPTAGNVRFEGVDLVSLSRSELRRVRRRMQIVFQDPYASLNPRMTVRDIVGEPLHIHGEHKGQQGRQRIDELLRTVGLSPEHANRFPHEFSGGQRQRIAIARALAPRPRVLIGDEPVSALDVSVRAQILNLLEDLRVGFDLTLILVSHDLSVVRHMCDRVLVMSHGAIVEEGPTRQIFRAPRHDYTRLLLESIPTVKNRRAASK